MSPSAFLPAPAVNPSAAVTAASTVEATPFFLLSPQGLVLSANEAARQFWQAGASELIGVPFVRLFVFEVVSDDPAFLSAQWEVLEETATRAPVTLQAQPHESAPGEVRLRLEKALGPLDVYFATVTPAPGVAAPGVEAPLAAHPSEWLIAQSGLGFFDLNLRDGTVYYSPAWKKLLGYVDAELPSTYATWQRLLHPEDSAAAPDQTGPHLLTPGPHRLDVEYRMKHRLGYWVWLQCVGLRLIGSAGQVERVVGLHLDISERKETEESLLASDAWLQTVGSARTLAAFSVDFVKGTCWLAPAWARFCGQPVAEGKTTIATLCQLLPPADNASGLASWFATRGIIGEPSFVEATQLRHHAGHWVPVLLGAHRTYSRRHELQRLAGFCCPIPADLFAAAPTVTPTQAWLDTVLSTLAEAVIVTDVLGNIRDLNAAAGRLLQLRLSQALGHPLPEIFRLVDRTTGKPPSEDPCTQAIHAHEPLPLCSAHALLLAAPEARPLPIVWTARTYSRRGAQPEGTVLIFRNPDELSLTPDELIKVNRFETLGLLAGSIAHDFNNLLTSILGGISLANDNHDYTRLPDSEQSCLAAKALSKQLLTVAKGGTNLRHTVTPGEILDDAIRLAAAGSSTLIQRAAAEDLPTIRVDRAQMLQVFQNLIVNAIQAMPPPPHRGRIHLSLATVSLHEASLPSLPPGHYVRFEVRDNASGIRPENLAKIWDPFFTTKRNGTGLGLATVQNIVQQHGGLVTVESEVGVGTLFTVYLPVAEGPAEKPARRVPTLRYGTGRILLLDDDPRICALTANMLESLHYKYDIARTGEEAIKLYRSYLHIGRPYDVVLMDLTIIGGMGGEDAFLELKEIDPDIRAIVSTGYDNEDMLQRYLNLGFNGYVTKPYRVADLARAIKSVLE